MIYDFHVDVIVTSGENEELFSQFMKELPLQGYKLLEVLQCVNHKMVLQMY